MGFLAPIAGPLLAGAGMSLINRATSKPSKVRTQTAQIMSPQDLSSLIGQTRGLLGSSTPSFSPIDFGQNVYRGMYEQTLRNPYMPTSAENQLLENIMGQTSSQFARRGLGASPIAASTVAGSIAPSLIAMRQQQLGNILSGLGGEQAMQQMMLSQRGMDIQSALSGRQQQLGGLLELIGLGRPYSLGQTQTGGRPGIFEGAGGFMQGIAGLQSAFNPPKKVTSSLGQG